MHFIVVFGSCQGKAGNFSIRMNAFLINLFAEIGKRFDELILVPINWIFLLEERIEVIFLCLCGGVFLNIDWVLENFWVVHRAPSNETAMIGERRELVLFDISMNSLLDVKVFAHLLYNLNKTINQ